MAKLAVTNFDLLILEPNVAIIDLYEKAFK